MKITISQIKPVLILTLIIFFLSSRHVQHFGTTIQLDFRGAYIVHIYAEATRAGGMHINKDGSLNISFQADIGLSRQPESLILDNKISLPFKPCQIPLKSRPPNNVDMLQWNETYHKSERPGMSLFFPLKYGSKSWVLSLWAQSIQPDTSCPRVL